MRSHFPRSFVDARSVQDYIERPTLWCVIMIGSATLEVQIVQRMI